MLRLSVEDHTLSIVSDLCWYGAVFLAAWVVYILAYVVAARLRWVKNVNRRVVIMANLSALITGVLSWLLLGTQFSSPNTWWIATVTAPIAFLGFCAIFIFMGPANVDRSVSFSILLALKDHEGKTIPRDQLIDVVPFERIFQKRLQELIQYGLIALPDDRIQITPQGKRTIRFFRWLGRLLNVDPQ
ncbi:MAG: hypothetical protein KIT25_10580 [Enhydrobacter sp.]|nr:MAG: hypothetical protein KIT25_10580 [Enhydrobacter sp.]